MSQEIYFEKATFSHKDMVFKWLDEPHVIEFWDNSPEHRLDIINFMEGRKTRSPYFNGDHDYYYWVGFVAGEPFSMTMTSELIPEECLKENSPHLPYLSKTGKSIALDFMIGNPDYVGKGLAAPTLIAFPKFFQNEIDPMADTFVIDPSDTNPRAQHVYAKAGFEVVGEYTSERGYFEGGRSLYMIKKLPIIG